MRALIPTCEPSLTSRDLEAVATALRLGHVALGPEVEWFEEAVAQRECYRYAVATNSGSSALYLAMRVMGVGPGSRVTVPALTFIATAEAVVQCGGEVDIVDHGQPCNIPVNFYGHPPRGGLALVEDACEGLGSSPPSWAPMRCLSFNGNKIITAGAGGMILTDDADDAATLRALVTHNRLPGIEYIHGAGGFNYRMPAMNAALGLSQLARLDAHVAAKRETAAHYESLGVQLVNARPGTTSTFWMPVALLDREAAPVIQYLQSEGIGARAVWYPLHRQPPFQAAARGRCDVADDLHRRGLILPCSVGITPQERETVVAALRRALDTADAPAATHSSRSTPAAP